MGAVILYQPIGFSLVDTQLIAVTLNNSRGWGKIAAFKEEFNSPKFTITLMKPSALKRLYPQTWLRGLSVCDLRTTPIQVFINEKNWLNIPPASRFATLEDARTYVINHEVGHVLGLKHPTQPRTSGPSPVMIQQTLGQEPHSPNPWPLESEINQVFRTR